LAEGKSLDPKDLAARVIELLEPEFAAAGFDLLDVRVFRGGGRHQLRIYLDTTDGGISLDQVTAASRTAGMLLEEADPIPGQYVIEVSSPGIRRPLRTPDHFAAALGEKVDLKVAARDMRRLRGVLKEAGGGNLTVETEIDGETTTVTVALSQVLEGNLDPEFDAQALINADRRQKRDEKRKMRRAKRGQKKSRPKAPKDAGPDQE
jgi:ribosome maturation factor RimP